MLYAPTMLLLFARKQFIHDLFDDLKSDTAQQPEKPRKQHQQQRPQQPQPQPKPRIEFEGSVVAGVDLR